MCCKGDYIDKLEELGLKPNFIAIESRDDSEIKALLKDIEADMSVSETLDVEKVSHLGQYNEDEEFIWKDYEIWTTAIMDDHNNVTLRHESDDLVYEEVRNRNNKIKSYSLMYETYLLCKNISLESSCATFDAVFKSKKIKFNKMLDFARYLKTTNAIAVLMQKDIRAPHRRNRSSKGGGFI